MVIVIPYRNNPSDLAVLLMQLQQQRQKPKAVFLADNSVDGSGFEIAKRYHFDKSVPFAIQRNVGNIHKSWNAGINFFAGQDVALLNDDCLISWDFVDSFSAYASSGAAEMYCPANSGFPPTGRIRQGYEWYSSGQLGYYFVDEPQYELPPSITGWCMVIPNSTILKLGTFDEKFKLYFGDKDYEMRIFKSGGRIAFIKGLNVQHYGSSSTLKVEPKKIDKQYKHDEALYKAKYRIGVRKDETERS